ncbi:MAG: hypothetical protein WCO04_04330 [Pseudomonadota bacterium]
MFYSLAGLQMQIGSAALAMKATAFSVSDFSAVVWNTIGEAESLQPLVVGSKPVEFDALFPAFKRRVKGARDFGTMDLVYGHDAIDAGQILLATAEQAIGDYPFRILMTDAAVAGLTQTVTGTIAAPGVFTTPLAHGLSIGSQVKFSTTGALPTGIVAGTFYYVLTVPLTTTFTLAATAGGAAITTSGTQSGVHTLVPTPTSSQRLFIAKVMAIEDSFGGTEDVAKRKATIAINCQPVAIPPNP